MRRSPPSAGLTTVCSLRLTWGIALLFTPAAVLSLAGADLESEPLARRIARFLGLRHVSQAILTLLVAPDRPSLVGQAGALADLAHAATAVVVVVRGGRWRGAALVDCAVASTFGLADLLMVGPLCRPTTRASTDRSSSGQGQAPA